MLPTDSVQSPGLSVFFPAYNDSRTIASMVVTALQTARVLDELECLYPQVRAVHHPKNSGYGGALRSGFSAAAKGLIFYTDGDAQYDPSEMALLWAEMKPDVDLVNGYKISRSDPLHRIIIGRLYHHTVKLLFGLKVRDVDCDFRLIRRSIFEQVQLKENSGVICLEMMKKIQDENFRFAEVPVHHYHRAYGRSQFFNVRRVAKTAIDAFRLWWEPVVRQKHLTTTAAARSRSRFEEPHS